MHVDRAVEGLQRVALQRVHDLVARQHPSGALRQHHQQIELVAGEVAGLAVEPRDALAEVDLQPAEAQHLVAGGLWRGAAQQCLHPRQELARLEGLGQVVVGARVDPLDPLGPGPARRQHQDRKTPAGCAPAFQHRQAVELGQAKV